MDLLDFWCPPDGDLNKAAVKIKIPAVCCGVKVVISPSTSGKRDTFTDVDTKCSTHMSFYPDIWKLWIENKNAWGVKPKRKRSCRQCR